MLADALGRVRDGECVVDPTIVSRLVNRARSGSGLDELTEREREVLVLMAEGRSNKGLCARLFLSPKTVEAHVKHVFMKLGLDGSDDDRPTRAHGAGVPALLRTSLLRLSSVVAHGTVLPC